MFKKEDYVRGLEQLRKVDIVIEKDPITSGLDSVNSKIAEVQAAQSFVNSLLNEASANKVEAKVAHEIKKTEYGMEIDRLMVEDNEVKTQKSADARKAHANVKAAQLQLEEHAAKIDLIMAENYYNTIQQNYAHLENAFEALSRQLTAINLQLGLGQLRQEDLGGRIPKSTKGKKLSLKETDDNDA